jgi:hypothetical protein
MSRALARRAGPYAWQRMKPRTFSWENVSWIY